MGEVHVVSNYAAKNPSIQGDSARSHLLKFHGLLALFECWLDREVTGGCK